MQPWFRVVDLRQEVREGRSFDPSEFAIHLEQVVAGKGPEDYRDPHKFFARTYFTRALTEHVGMVLRRLSGETANTAPVLSFITQFGGGKTHTLTTLLHLARGGQAASAYTGVADVLRAAHLTEAPAAKVAVFVGNAWDPKEGIENPWVDVAHQLAGKAGIAVLGPTARTTPPGTDAIGRLFEAAGGPVLVLFDEVLNFINRHKGMADSFYAFIQNMTVATTGASGAAMVISLPRSQVEMSEGDVEWQEKITKVVRRVAKDLMSNDEAEISEVVRRRLFENLGNPRTRRSVAQAYADWCFERRHQLPPEWTAVDTATTEAGAREHLRLRFEACYPFHPATLSVFQRKWAALSQYQQTRSTLAMLAQWISWAYQDGFAHARREPLITLGSAPLEVPEFRSVVLGQLGEGKLNVAIQADIAGPTSHSLALDADAKGALAGIHRRVAGAILFESTGGQKDGVARLPELRFALGEPEVDTTSIDNAAAALEAKSFFVQRVGSDGFKVYHKATLRKAVADRRASLSDEVGPAVRDLVAREFRRRANVPVEPFPEDGASVPDSPRLTLVLVDPTVSRVDPQAGEAAWKAQRQQLAEWTRHRGTVPRSYPAALIWCLKKPGRDLREKVETWLAWKRVARDVQDGTLGSDYEGAELSKIAVELRTAENEACEEVWASYRYAVLLDCQEPDGLKEIDLGAGHTGAADSLCARVITALKSYALLNETVGAGYLERNWPQALKQSGAWPLSGLRQSFLDGSMTRLLDPDTVLRSRIVDFVGRGEFGLASGPKQGGGYDRVWFGEPVPAEEVAFEAGVFLLLKERARELRRDPDPAVVVAVCAETRLRPNPYCPRVEDVESAVGQEPQGQCLLHAGGDRGLVRVEVCAVTGLQANAYCPETTTIEVPAGEPLREVCAVHCEPRPQKVSVRLSGTIPPDTWNRFGMKVVPKLRSGEDLKVEVSLSVTVDAGAAESLKADLRQALADLGLGEKMRVNGG